MARILETAMKGGDLGVTDLPDLLPNGLRGQEPARLLGFGLRQSMRLLHKGVKGALSMPCALCVLYNIFPDPCVDWPCKSDQQQTSAIHAHA